MVSTRKPPSYINEQQWQLLDVVRRVLIMALGALEDYMQLERSIVPRHKRGPLPKPDTLTLTVTTIAETKKAEQKRRAPPKKTKRAA